jgi:radical SAM superfamily enzyme YgiQ (UPF0313 family)
MIRKILLVYPEFPETYWGFQHSLKFTNQKAGFPPLGLLTVASMLPDNFKVTLVDMNVRPLKDSDIIDADFVFVSAMIVQKSSFENVVRQCNRLDKPVVAGGPFPTSGHEKITGVSHFVLGEAEVTLPHFLADLEKGRLEEVYESPVKPDIRNTPIPRFDLVNLKDYSTMMVQYSRGCPFQCEFCDIIELFGRVPRVKTPGQFLAELDSLKQAGHIGSVFVVDDNFIGNKSELRRLLPLLIEWQENNGKPFSFFTEASVDLAGDDNLMSLMVEAGFNMVFLGIETPVKESLLSAGKGQNTKTSLLESVHAIQRKGLEVSAGFILGFDNDPEDIFDRQLDFIEKSAIPMAMVGLLMALPKTRLSRRLIVENRMRGESTGNNTHDDSGLNFVPVMSEERLKSGYKRVLSAIYEPEAYYKRCTELIGILPKSSGRHGSGIGFVRSLVQGGAFVKSLFVQGLSYYGAHYFRFLFQTLIKNPANFIRAVKLAIQGHHFFMITHGKPTKKAISLRRIGQYLHDLLKRVKNIPVPLAVSAQVREIHKLVHIRKKLVPRLFRKTAGVKPGSAIEFLLKDLAVSLKERSSRLLHSFETALHQTDRHTVSWLSRKITEWKYALSRIRIKLPSVEQAGDSLRSVLLEIEFAVDQVIIGLRTRLNLHLALVKA